MICECTQTSRLSATPLRNYTTLFSNLYSYICLPACPSVPTASFQVFSPRCIALLNIYICVQFCLLTSLDTKNVTNCQNHELNTCKLHLESIHRPFSFHLFCILSCYSLIPEWIKLIFHLKILLTITQSIWE